MLQRSNHSLSGIIRRNLPLLLIVMLLIYLSACSSINRYQVLSFFFDGVPNPNDSTTIHLTDSISTKDSTALAQNLISNAPPAMNFHSPYQEKECASCHDQSSMGKLTKPQPGLCYDCHEDFSNKFKFLHGPVGGGQCTTCHSPHMSENKNLLTRTDQALCLYCHESEQIAQMESHQDIQGVNCTECHNPHGGEDKYILR